MRETRLFLILRRFHYSYCNMPVTEQGLFLTDRPHREAIVAVDVDHIAAVRIEVEVPRVARAVSVERPRPIVAVGAREVELTVPAAVSSR